MNINKQQVDDLNAELTIEVKPDDYQPQVDKLLKDYRKRANMPGFRPGHVPMGMIRKMYGTAVKAEEINKLISESLYKYIEENNLSILGNPLPKEEGEETIDMKNQESFEFTYELALAPQFQVNVSSKSKFNQYKIAVGEKEIDKHVGDIAKRYGKIETADVATANDMLYGEFTELDETGEIKEGGVKHTSTISIEFLEDDTIKQSLIGKKADDKFEVNPKDVSKGEADMAAMLGIEKKDLPGISNRFQYKVANVYRMKPAETNQELFDKVFGEGNVKSEAEFRGKVSEEIAKHYEQESEAKLQKDIIEHYIDKLRLKLPDEFLKRWLVEVNKEGMKKDEVENEYDKYSKGLKWQLIENQVIKENSIKVEQEEAVNHAKGLIFQQYLRYGLQDITEQQLDDAAKKLLAEKEEGRKIFEQLYSNKVMELFKSTFTLKEKEVTYDESVKLVTEKPSKFRLFERVNNLIKS